MTPPQKIASVVDDAEVELQLPAIYCRATTRGTERLEGCIPAGDPDILLGLVECLEDPFVLLYLLHTPRGEAMPGRYTSPQLSREELVSFVRRFAAYLTADARFDLWVHSPESRGTLVWDRHNLLFAYGPLEDYAAALHRRGFSEGELPGFASAPHAHHYRAEFDAAAREVLEAFDWWHSPLRPEDEQ